MANKTGENGTGFICGNVKLCKDALEGKIFQAPQLCPICNVKWGTGYCKHNPWEKSVGITCPSCGSDNLYNPDILNYINPELFQKGKKSREHLDELIKHQKTLLDVKGEN